MTRNAPHTWGVVVMGRLRGGEVRPVRMLMRGRSGGVGGGAWRVVLMGKLGRGGVFVGSGTRSMGGPSWSVVIMRLI